MGMFYLVMGLLIDLAVPAYIGFVTNDISNGIEDNLVSLSVLILIIIGVSCFVYQFNSGGRSAAWALGSALLCSAIWRTRFRAAFGLTTSQLSLKRTFPSLTRPKWAKSVSGPDLISLCVVGRQNNDISLINEVLSNSFNIVIRSLCYTVLAMVILFVISA